jgi:hypothetical protein
MRYQGNQQQGQQAVENGRPIDQFRIPKLKFRISRTARLASGPF